MHNIAGCHTSHITRQFLEEDRIQAMDCPDINPIEQMLDELKRKVQARNHLRIAMSSTALLEEWKGNSSRRYQKGGEIDVELITTWLEG